MHSSWWYPFTHCAKLFLKPQFLHQWNTSADFIARAQHRRARSIRHMMRICDVLVTHSLHHTHHSTLIQ